MVSLYVYFLRISLVIMNKDAITRSTLRFYNVDLSTSTFLIQYTVYKLDNHNLQFTEQLYTSSNREVTVLSSSPIHRCFVPCSSLLIYAGIGGKFSISSVVY